MPAYGVRLDADMMMRPDHAEFIIRLVSAAIGCYALSVVMRLAVRVVRYGF